MIHSIKHKTGSETFYGKARILLTLADYEIVSESIVDEGLHLAETTKMNQQFPINRQGRNKTMMGKAFYHAHFKAISSLDFVQKVLENGNTSIEIEIENSKW